MSTAPLPSEPSRDDLLAEVEALRHRVAVLQQTNQDLEVMLAMATEHADDLSDALEHERDDLAVMLEMTTEHADAVEEELHSRAEALEARSQFIRDTFGRYVSEAVVAQLLDAPEGLELGGEKRTVTILMSDLRGFTAVAERLDPHQVMRFLNRYLEAMVNVILSYQGTIIEMLGDGLLVLESVNALLRQEGLPDIEMGIGIHTGDVVVGNIGSAQRTKYGVVGSAVNLTGRIESYTMGSQILVSPTTYAATAALLLIIQALTVAPKGVPGPITLYDVGGIGGAYHLFLPGHHEELVPLAAEVPVRYTVLEGKFAGPTVWTGRLVKLAAKAAELQTDEPVASFSNLKMHLLHPDGEVVPGDLFAKVLGAPNAMATRVVIHFTSVPQEVRTFLHAALMVL
jgi:adenylate cyclase